MNKPKRIGTSFSVALTLFENRIARAVRPYISVVLRHPRGGWVGGVCGRVRDGGRAVQNAGAAQGALAGFLGERKIS